MADHNHLVVPDSGFASINTGNQHGGDNGEPGRRRSWSSRSSNSQRSPRNSIGGETESSEPDQVRTPSIRIAHQPSRGSLRDGGSTPGQHSGGGGGGAGGYFGLGYLNPARVGRSRSNSEPTRPVAEVGTADRPGMRSGRGQTHMPGIAEISSTGSENVQADTIEPVSDVQDHAAGALPPLRYARTNIHEQSLQTGEYEDNLVDFLDVVDPEVATLTTLTNVQNSLFVPSLGKYVNRRPTYTLSKRRDTVVEDSSSTDEDIEAPGTAPTTQERPTPERLSTGATLNTITSRVQDKYYAVLPHGVQLKGWSEEDKLELNDHVRHMLHSRRSKFKRSMRGFGQYVRRPLGFFVTLYATLITLFGLIWVLFLIGWIKVGGNKKYIVHIVDSVLVALFAIVGDGLAPFRAVDTYHMCFIAHYHHLTWRLRREQALPALQNKSDLPALPPNSTNSTPSDAAAAEKAEPAKEYSVLTPEQQRKLEHHQKKFARSHSFYKPHETYTHHAFSLRLLVAIVVLLDVHSLLQISLGATTWGIDYKVRPFAITTVILCCSITVNILAGVLISIGDHRSRKKDVIEQLFRQQLTEEAMRKVERKRERQVRRDLEARGIEGDEEAVRRFVSPPPIVLERTSMEVRRELEQKKVDRDAVASGKTKDDLHPPLEESDEVPPHVQSKDSGPSIV